MFKCLIWFVSTKPLSRRVFQEDVFIFKEKFHGYIFVDAKGNEYPAIVEFAPYQRMGRIRSKKVDRKCDTYETSEHFLEFVRTMDTEEALPKLELKSDFEAKHDNQIRSTPLLEFLNDKKSRKRDRDRKQPQERKKILAPIKEDVAKENTRPQKQDKQRPQLREGDGGGMAKRERPERSEKEKARRAERDKMRREKRQQQVVEKKRERDLLKQQKPNEASHKEPKEVAASVPSVSEKTSAQSEDAKKPARDAKKYSERRQENRAKAPATAKRSEEAAAAVKAQGGRDADRKSDPEKPADGEKKKESRRYSERRVRNKDRPAIQIYQPGSSSSKVRKGGETEE